MNPTPWTIRNRAIMSIAAAIALTVSLPQAVRAIDVIWTGNAGDDNWNTAGNWTGSFVPAAPFEEVGVINNGDTAFVATATPAAAGLDLGQMAGESGGLEVRAGGSIDFLDSTGAPDGSMNIGEAGQGTLLVRPGGSVTGASLNVNGQSSLTIGGPGAGAASLVIGGAVNLNGTTRIIGAGHTFSGNGVGLGGGSTLIAQITSATHSPIRSTGGATVDGDFRLEFSGGFTPAPGNTWNIVDATTISGTFDNLDVSAAPAPAPGTAYQLVTVPGGAGQLLQLQLNRFVRLLINTDNGAVSLSSPSGVTIPINGYSIQSEGGLLNVAQWSSLQDQGASGWHEATPRASALSELNSNVGGSLNVGTGAVNLGTPYTTPATFGTSPDLQFTYSTPTGQTVQGIVEYTGSATANNLLLNVDPTTGQVQLRNSSKTTLQLVGYSILSESGSLLTSNGDWQSLDDQNVGSWLEANSTATALNEIFAGVGATTLGPGQVLNVGAPYNEASGSRDLDLRFALAGEQEQRFGVVRYGPIAVVVPLNGDYNSDGKVDAADYVVWRKTIGTLPAYNTWRTNFGRTAGSGSAILGATAAVPEPASWLFVAFGAVVLGNLRRHRPKSRDRER